MIDFLTRSWELLKKPKNQPAALERVLDKQQQPNLHHLFLLLACRSRSVVGQRQRLGQFG